MVHLREITKENLDAVLELKITKEQETYVSTVAHSLAQAWVYRDTAYPFAVYDEDMLVGFVMMGFYEAKQQYTLWKLLIDERYQHRSYGRQTVELAKRYLIDTFGVTEIYLGVHEDNGAAIHLYQSAGFTATGDTDRTQIEMKWTVKSPSKREEHDMRWKNDSTYQGTAKDEDFYFHSPIADADTWVFMSDELKAQYKDAMRSLDESHRRSIVTPSYLNSYEHPDYLWLMYELNNLRRAYNASQRDPRTDTVYAGHGQIPYVQLRLKENATSNKTLYPCSTLNNYGSEKKPHYVIEFEYSFLRAFMNFLFTIFDDNPQQLAEINGETVVTYQHKAPIYRQPPFDGYFPTRHDLPGLMFHKAVQMLLAHELAHVGCGHLDLMEYDPTFGRARDTLLVEEDDADTKAVCWLLGIRFLEVPGNRLAISYKDLKQELALTVFTIYLLYTWSYSKDERVWTGNELEAYHQNREDHLPYQLRAFRMISCASRRLTDLGVWSMKDRTKTSDKKALTPSFFKAVYNDAIQMIKAYEHALHLFYAHTENVYDTALNENIAELQNMILREQDTYVRLTKYQIPWLLGFEAEVHAELQRLQKIRPSVHERLKANGVYCV